MNGCDASNTIVQDYLDALLQAPSAAATPDDAATVGAVTVQAWQQCTLGRLQLLLPADALLSPVPCAQLPPPANADWYGHRVIIGTSRYRVAELARCLAVPHAGTAVDIVLPIAESDWALAVPGPLQAMSLALDAIQWRTRRTSRPWLAGMSRDGRCMVLDMPSLIEHIAAVADIAIEESP